MPWTLRPNLAGPLYKQVFETLRLAIAEAVLGPGQRLPATRELAGQLGVARNTVITAYEMLMAEGYLEARAGSGYFVSARIPEQGVFVQALKAPAEAQQAEAMLSRRGQFLASASRPVPKPEQSAFSPGLPALDAFPFEQWYRCLQQVSRKPPEALLRYQDQGGDPRLKAALRDYLQTSRGVRCTAEQIILVGGSQAGLDLVARLLINEGDTIAVEDPGYLGAKDGFLAAGANLLPIPVDEDGLRIDALHQARGGKSRKIKEAPRLVYTTPSYQFPLGATLSLQRRIDLLNWAREHNAFILEDDYDSEYRYGSRPLSSLQGLDQQGRVIYMGTFSKVMFPGLRLGYLVVPQGLSAAFANALRKTGQDAPLLLQAAMAEFIRAGYFPSHLRKMRKLYLQKQELFLAIAQRQLSHWLHLKAASAGMQLVCEYKVDVNEILLLKAAREQGLVLSPLSRYFLETPSRQGLYIGYTGVPLNQMEQSVLKLKRAFTGVENAATCKSPAIARGR